MNSFAAVLGAVTLALLSGSPAQANFIANIDQDGLNVDATGSGSLDLTDLTFSGTETGTSVGNPRVKPDEGVLVLGSTISTDVYTGFTGPTNFGPGGLTNASSDTGGRVTIEFGSIFVVTEGYASGSFVSDSAIFDDTTIAALGLTEGTYTWTWGSGADADSYVLNVGPVSEAVPEPASLALFAPALLGLGFYRRRSKRKAM
jgi:hypothetical protein